MGTVYAHPHQYPFLFLLLPLIGGIFIGDALFPSEWSIISYALLGLSGISLPLTYYLTRKSRYTYSFTIHTSLTLLLLGISLSCKHWNETKLDVYEKEDIYTLTLEDNKHQTEHSFRFTSSIGHRKIYLYIEKDSLSSTLKRGDIIQLRTIVKPFQGRGNSYEFDYPTYIRRNGYAGYAYVTAKNWKYLSYRNSSNLRQKAEDCRSYLVELIHSWNLGTDEEALLCALTVGERKLLSESLRDTYRDSGAAHVLALSGLHVGLIFMLLIGIARLIWHFFRWLKPFFVVLILALLWGFAFLTGLSASVVRSVIMFSLLTISTLQYEKVISYNILFATAFLMLVFRPMWLFDVSFQLSFTAVMSILYFAPRISSLLTVRFRPLRYVWNTVSVSLAAQLGVMPLVVYYFGRISVHFLISSICILPLTTIILYLSIPCFFFVPFAQQQAFMLFLLNQTLYMQNQTLRWVEHLPGAVIEDLYLNVTSVWLIYAAGISIALLLLYFAKRLVRPPKSLITISAIAAIPLLSIWADYIRPRFSPVLSFYNMSSCPAVRCMNNHGSHTVYYTDTARADTSGLRKVMQPHLRHLRLTQPVVEYAESLITCNQYRILPLHTEQATRNIVPDKQINIDFLYLSRGFKGEITPLLDTFHFAKVILDSSLWPSERKKLIEECVKKSIPYHDLSEQGALTIY
ncbi:MAG: ComEC/Rec2 family competence protein [Bacteroidales bacterium]|nr:ComEC/Rec2 family competence protein [Bacteroidales bacterium]